MAAICPRRGFVAASQSAGPGHHTRSASLARRSGDPSIPLADPDRSFLRKPGEGACLKFGRTRATLFRPCEIASAAVDAPFPVIVLRHGSKWFHRQCGDRLFGRWPREELDLQAHQRPNYVRRDGRLVNVASLLPAALTEPFPQGAGTMGPCAPPGL